jgi:chemotaxis protein MotB
MKKILMLSLSTMLLLSSCVSKKDFAALETKQKNTQDLLNTATVKLNACLSDEAAATARANALEDRISDLRKSNDNLIQSNKGLTMLTAKGADNIEKTLESIKEKDLKITRLQDALNKKDSVTLALVTSLKREVGINDPDIEINVEKGVVFISISDKLLFKSGSYTVTTRAKDVLAKVAKVVNGKPDFECMVEGHTDNKSFQKGVLLDNWDLSVKRSTAIVRVLEELDVNPQRLIAAGRSFYVPLVDNDTAENRAKNRRTRIVIMPKIDQFYDMIEKEMKNLSTGN